MKKPLQRTAARSKPRTLAWFKDADGGESVGASRTHVVSLTPAAKPAQPERASAGSPQCPPRRRSARGRAGRRGARELLGLARRRDLHHVPRQPEPAHHRD
jgi:hypothetical protein